LPNLFARNGSGGGGRGGREYGVLRSKVVRCQFSRKVDLCPDGVGKVRNHKNVLDVGVEHSLDFGSIDLRGKAEGVEEELSDSGGGGGLILL
jgi:hypothetical protein